MSAVCMEQLFPGEPQMTTYGLLDALQSPSSQPPQKTGYETLLGTIWGTARNEKSLTY